MKKFNLKTLMLVSLITTTTPLWAMEGNLCLALEDPSSITSLEYINSTSGDKNSEKNECSGDFNLTPSYRTAQDPTEIEADRLKALVADPQVDTLRRIYAVCRLGKFGEKYKPAAATVLKSIAEDPQVHVEERIEAAERLSYLDTYEGANCLWKAFKDADKDNLSEYEQNAKALFETLDLAIQEEVKISLEHIILR